MLQSFGCLFSQIYAANNHSYHFIHILLVLQKKGYHINLKTNTCEVFDLNDPFQRIAIPKNAKLDGEVYIGTSSIPGAGVEVDMWSGNTTDPVGMSYYVEYNYIG